VACQKPVCIPTANVAQRPAAKFLVKTAKSKISVRRPETQAGVQQDFTNQLSCYVIPVIPTDMLLFLVRTCAISIDYSLHQGDVPLTTESFL
jgi:hypothetical protein